MMNKEDILTYLDKRRIPFQITEHKAVYNMIEASTISLPYPDAIAKNLLLCNDKKSEYYLVTIKGNKKIDLKQFRKDNGLRKLTFASNNDLYILLNVEPGTVSPFGLLNDHTNKVQWFIDQAYINEMIGVHPNDNHATVWLDTNQLILIIQEHGNPIHIVKI